MEDQTENEMKEQIKDQYHRQCKNQAKWNKDKNQRQHRLEWSNFVKYLKSDFYQF